MSKIKIVRTGLLIHTEPWYEARKNSLGASEVSSVLGLSQFTPAAKTFAEKVGIIEPFKSANKFTFWGSAIEELIATAWTFYSGEEDSYIQNEREGKVQRICRKINGHFLNLDHPHLTASPDRIINKGSFSLIDKSPLMASCPIEIKTVSGFEMKRWETGIPPYYLAQIHAQMLCMGSNYGELAILEDGRSLHVYPIQRSEELINIIIEKTTSFWNDRVIPAKKLMERMATANEKEKEEIATELYRLEPLPEPTEAYQEFLKERYKTEPISREITAEEHGMAVMYDSARAIAKNAEADMLFAKNKLLHSMQGVEEVKDEVVKVVNRPASETQKRAFFAITFKK